MGIENFKRWHWMMLGLLVGLALGFMNQESKPGDDGWTGRTVGQAGFERVAVRAPVNGNPVVKNVRLFPSEKSEATRQTVAVIAFDELVQVGQSEVWNYLPTRFTATEPVRLLRGPRTDEGMTVRRYLDELARRNPSLHYRYAWWNEERNAYLLWGGGGLFVIGIVWPTIVNLLIGAGLGRPPREKKVAVPTYSSAPEPKPAPASVVQDDGALENLNASLEKELEAAGVLNATSSDDPEDSAAGEAVIKSLNAGPLDAPAPGPEQMTRPSENFKGGVFYPVARGPAKPD